MSESQVKAGGLEAVVSRAAFYRDGYKLLLTANVAQAVIILVLLVLTVVLATRPEKSRYFTVDTAGRLTPAVPIDQPYLTESQVLDFAARAVSGAYSFDAVNYRKQIGDLEQYFTPDGFVAFRDSLTPQVKYVVDHTLISSAVPTNTPVLVQTANLPGAGFAWKVRIPMTVTLRGEKESATVKRVVTVVIVRRQTYETPFGVGISQFIAQDV